MESYQVLAAAQMAVRWIHVFAAILWIGQTFLFHVMERHLAATPSTANVIGRMWMLHGGGYYQVEKRPFAAGMPEDLVWFKWEAAATWLSGAVLIGLTYYAGGLLVEQGAEWGPAAAAGIGAIVFGWVVYDMLVRSPLGSRPVAFAAVGLILILLLQNGLSQMLSPRSAYVHVGAVIGTIMAANVWMRILPAQRRLLSAARSGEPAPSSISSTGPLRSRHNSFLVVPLVLIMISNHYPTVSYGNDHSTLILGVVVLLGWAAARWLLGGSRARESDGTSEAP